MNQKSNHHHLIQIFAATVAALAAVVAALAATMSASASVQSSPLQERPDFIEAQMRFSPGTTPSCIYWQEIQTLEVHLQLEWTNFEKGLHDGGFDLNRAVSSYMLYPNTPENCAFERSTGVLEGTLPGQLNYVSWVFRGSACEQMAEYLNLGTIAIHHYEVPTLNNQLPATKVLRLQIWDHLPNLTCEARNLPSI